MPETGIIKQGRDIGYKNLGAKYVWLSCPSCGKERWIHLPKTRQPQFTGFCLLCSVRELNRSGEKNPCWKGGRKKTPEGYIFIKLQPDDFFFPMADKQGYVFEHRLVMAKHLGRCLQFWEKVHHKGIRCSGIENKSDNLKDNLELTTQGSHAREHSKGYGNGYAKGLNDGRNKQIQELKMLIEEQTKQIKLLQWLMKEKQGTVILPSRNTDSVKA